MARSPINSTASACVSASPHSHGQRLDAWTHAKTLGEQNLHQYGAGARPFVQGQCANLGDRHPREQLDRQHWPAAGDARVRDDRILRVAKEFDRRDQRDIQPPGGQISARRPGTSKTNSALRRQLLEPVNQRLGVQVADRAHADPDSKRCSSSSLLRRSVGTATARPSNPQRIQRRGPRIISGYR